MEHITLTGKQLRLEPLERRHAAGLAEAVAAADASLYQWATVPRDFAGFTDYIDTALAWKKDGRALAFAVVRADDGAVIGSTRLWDMERWRWPQGHARHGRETPDVGEIGYSWLAPSALRTGANTEAKLLLLTHAFERWQMLRVCFHTDVRNTRSAAAIERIGGKLEGTLQAHRLAVDGTPRDSLRYAIVAEDWPGVKELLEEKLRRHA